MTLYAVPHRPTPGKSTHRHQISSRSSARVYDNVPLMYFHADIRASVSEGKLSEEFL
jgi:hypothetical protein